MNALHGALPTARLEFEQALYSARSIVFAGIFALVMGGAGYAGLGLFFGRGDAAGGLGGSTAFLIAAMVLLVLFIGPMAAVLTTTDNLVAERQARTLDALLSRPTTRRGLVLGKFLGRGAHLAAMAAVGIAIGALIFATRAPLAAEAVLVFIALLCLLLALYAAWGLLASALAKTVGSAFAFGLVIWLAPIIIGAMLPGWLEPIGLGALAPWLNPNTLFLAAVGVVFSEPGNLAGLQGSMTWDQGLLGLGLHLAFALGLAIEVFHRQDEAGT